MISLQSPNEPRVRKAASLVARTDEWKTFLHDDGRVSYSLPASKPGVFYRVTDNGCTCNDLKYRPWVDCKHMISVRLFEALRAVQEPAF